MENLQQEFPEDHKYDVIDPEAILDIKISTGFYNRIQSVLNYLTKDKTIDQMNEVYTAIQKQTSHEDHEIYTLETLFILIKEFQEKAFQAGFVKKLTKAEIEKLMKETYPDAEFDIADQNDEYLNNSIKDIKDEFDKDDFDKEEDKEEPAD